MDDIYEVPAHEYAEENHLDDLLKRELAHSKYDPIPKSEELALARKAKAGDVNARNRLINANLRLISKWSSKSSGSFRMDVFQEGVLAAMTVALKYFNPEKGLRFSTYLQAPVQQAMGKLRDRCVAVNSDRVRVYRAIEKIKDTREATGEPVGATLLADLPGCTIERVHEALTYLEGETSLHWSTQDDEGEELQLINVLADGNPLADPADLLERCDEALDWRLDEAMAGLSDVQRKVFDREFGLHGHESMGREEIGRELGLERAGVTRLVGNVMRSIRSRIPAELAWA